MAKHVVIYVPGLGDHMLNGRQTLLKFWKHKDIDIEICPIEWRVNQTWEFKLGRLLDRIDHLHRNGQLVSLIGESAGATAVIQALKHRYDQVNAVILLCGKSQYPQRVAGHLYQNNPALKVAMSRSHEAVASLNKADKAKIINLHPLFDPVVPVWETKIPGVKNSTVPSIGHASSIVFTMVVWKLKIARFIRSRAELNGK